MDIKKYKISAKHLRKILVGNFKIIVKRGALRKILEARLKYLLGAKCLRKILDGYFKTLAKPETLKEVSKDKN